MGKKAKAKELRKIAAMLPVMVTTGYSKSTVSGEQLLTIGIDTIPGAGGKEAVEPSGVYIQRTPVAVPVNHKRRMKNLHKKYGIAGIGAYVKHVESVLKANAAR